MNRLKILRPIVGMLLSTMVLLQASASAEVIDFDGLPKETVVTDQFPSATFSSSTGNSNRAIEYDGADSLPNILCTGPIGEPQNCIEDTYIDFAIPVNDLTFWAIAANVSGPTATFNVYEDGVFSGSVLLNGGGGNVFADLSQFSDVTRLEIVDILDDPNNRSGIGWDTFSFTLASEVPEVPAVSWWGLITMVLLLLGSSTAIMRWRR